MKPILIYREYAVPIGLAFTLFVVLLMGAHAVAPVFSRWAAHWTEPYEVGVCTELLKYHPDALARVEDAYRSVVEAGQPGPESIHLVDCKRLDPLDVPEFTVVWYPGYPSNPGWVDEVTVRHENDVMVAAFVRVSLSEGVPEGLWRHAAWHTIGALHPYFAPVDHVLHPGEQRADWDWGTSTRGYRAE